MRLADARYILIGLAFIAGPIQAKEPSEEIAATVNGEAITVAEVNFQTQDRLRYFPELHGAALEAKRKELNHQMLAPLIDRCLIIQKFYRDGGKVPDGYIDARVADIVKNDYGGDHAAFTETLAERGVSLDKYRQEIANNYIVGWMRNKGDLNSSASVLRKGADIQIYNF